MWFPTFAGCTVLKFYFFRFSADVTLSVMEYQKVVAPGLAEPSFYLGVVVFVETSSFLISFVIRNSGFTIISIIIVIFVHPLEAPCNIRIVNLQLEISRCIIDFN